MLGRFRLSAASPPTGDTDISCDASPARTAAPVSCPPHCITITSVQTRLVASADFPLQVTPVLAPVRAARDTKPLDREAMAMGDPPETCSGCGTPGSGFKKCGRCKTACYCSAECQKKDWKAGHKLQCSTDVYSRASGGGGTKTLPTSGDPAPLRPDGPSEQFARGSAMRGISGPSAGLKEATFDPEVRLRACPVLCFLPRGFFLELQHCSGIRDPWRPIRTST
jgi:hypothetical protein